MAALVSIVGAGPGDPELLTLRARDRIMQAEAVVYDRLIPQAILDLIPPSAERYFAGKSRERHMMNQDEINNLLAGLADRKRRIVRLKGGDPTIFGRGGEEAGFLACHGIAFEIVPGISAASGISAQCGIPLTYRGLATGVRFVTGHAREGRELQLDWRSLADPDTTLVIYMGLATIGIIAVRLMEHGLPEDFPVAAIENGTTGKERVITGTLSGIAGDIAEAALEAPVLIIIGRVVTLRDSLRVTQEAGWDSRRNA